MNLALVTYRNSNYCASFLVSFLGTRLHHSVVWESGSWKGLVPRLQSNSEWSDTMLKRPTAADTEEDLLAFQQNFLSSGGRPAASVAAVPRAGEKRKQLQQGEHLEDKGRDVVQLQAEGTFVRCIICV